MFVGVIRALETEVTTVQADSLAGVRETLEAHRPEGFELISAPVTMANASTTLTALGTYARRDGLRDIEADDL